MGKLFFQVRPGVGENSEIEVWGEKRGDRIVATALVFGPLAGGAFE